MSRYKENKIIPVEEWDALYISGRHEELSCQLIKFIRQFANSSGPVHSMERREELNVFLKKFTWYLIQPDFRIPESDIVPYINLNGTIANLAACSVFINTDQWVKVLKSQQAPIARILILYSLRNRYRLSFEELFSQQPALVSLWYTRQFISSSLPAQRWLLQNARDMFAEMPDGYQILMPNSVLAGYFAITYIDPENERKFKQKLNAAIQKTRPAINPRHPRNRRSIAVITRRWFKSSAVYRALFPYLECLADKYELTLVNLARPDTPVETSLFSTVKYFPPLKDVRHLSEEQKQILEDQDWGVVYYPDIGMDVETVYLANYRLAPIQIMGYGHPASTQGSEIDYFITGQESEIPELAEKYFSERLVMLPGIGMIPVWPTKSIIEPARKAESDRVVINCPWTLLKINADIVDVLREITAHCAVPVKFRIFTGHDLDEMGAHPVYLQDLKDLLGDDTFELLGLISYQQFLAEMRKGDLTLVAYPFGGFNTVIDSLYVGVPVVAWEGEHGYNRFPPALLRRAGFPELIATNREEFKEKIIQLIQDTQYREQITSRIKQEKLKQRITADLDPCAFKRAVEYLIDNHETLVSDLSRQPLFIN